MYTICYSKAEFIQGCFDTLETDKFTVTTLEGARIAWDMITKGRKDMHEEVDERGYLTFLHDGFKLYNDGGVVGPVKDEDCEFDFFYVDSVEASQYIINKGKNNSTQGTTETVRDEIVE